MRVFALDIGQKRVGLAVGDTQSCVASPVAVLDASDVLGNAPAWQKALQDHEPDLLVCGMPVLLSGHAGKQAKRVNELAQRIAQQSGLSLEFMDERLSSAEAKQRLREQGLSEREMRGKIDAVAASIFLEAWLMRNAHAETEE